ncbi:MAG: GYD domain-containing protein [Brevefilum sp.]|nr:GYD domain-containing protein [Brevefilum sp.]
MLKYMILAKMTPEGTKYFKGWPASIDGVLETFTQMGGKLIGFYACGALYDFVGIGDLPSPEVAEMYRRLVVSGGLVEAQVIRLFTKEEFDQLIEALPTEL